MRKKIVNLILPDAPLSQGDKGMDVERLQLCLDHYFKLKGKKKITANEPARFGEMTWNYLMRFQAENIEGIPFRIGQLDAVTRQRLREVLQ